MITVTEKAHSRKSREGTNPQITRLFNIWGTNSDVAAKNALYQFVAKIYDHLRLREYDVEYVGPGPNGAGLWDGEVVYQQGESFSWRFETLGGTQKITQSLETVGSYAASGSPPDFGGAIGVTDNGVEGVDITVPVFNFTETHYLPIDFVDVAYQNLLCELTGTVNNVSFRAFAPGEVLFLGATGSQYGHEDWEVTYNFAGSKNQTALSVGNITGIVKNGWDYLWVRYEEDVDADKLVRIPRFAYVERVYPYTDFRLLEIGT